MELANQNVRLLGTLIRRCLFIFQVVLVDLFYWLGKVFGKGPQVDWVIGPNEIAGVVRSLRAVIPNSISVALNHRISSLYNDEFDVLPAKGQGPLLRMIEALRGPMLLGTLANRTSGFIYVGDQGFITSSADERRWEFEFLKRRSKKIVCLLTGSDIRSVKTMHQDAVVSGSENIATYIALLNPSTLSEEYERAIVRRCEVINNYADLVMTAPRDQASHLRSNHFLFLGLLPSSAFCESTNKFSRTTKPRIVHAPSSPFIKGTPLVRAAISRLKSEGYSFSYEEYISLANPDLMKVLREAHIVLNEFYAFVPGMLGLEALSNRCVLMTRASTALEPDLPGNPARAWVPTEPFEVYDKLKVLLDSPESWSALADAGFRWARNFASEENAGRELVGRLGNL